MFKTNEALLGKKFTYDGNPHNFGVISSSSSTPSHPLVMKTSSSSAEGLVTGKKFDFETFAFTVTGKDRLEVNSSSNGRSGISVSGSLSSSSDSGSAFKFNSSILDSLVFE